MRRFILLSAIVVALASFSHVAFPQAQGPWSAPQIVTLSVHDADHAHVAWVDVNQSPGGFRVVRNPGTATELSITVGPNVYDAVIAAIPNDNNEFLVHVLDSGQNIAASSLPDALSFPCNYLPARYLRRLERLQVAA